MLAGDGQQVYHAIVDGPQRGGQAGVAFSQFADAGRFKRGVVDKHRAAFAAGCNKGLGKSQRGVAAGEVEKGLVCGPPRAPQAVHAELEGKLLVGPCAFPEGHAELDGFKVDEVARQLVRSQGLCGGGLVEEGLARQGGGLDALLRGVEQVVGHVAQFADAVLLDVRFERLAAAR